MNPLAQELNNQLSQHNAHVLDMLSDLGKNLFFPKGILTQSAEAKEKAHRFNATIGIATEGKGPMFLQCIQDKLSAFDPKDIYPYAPPAGCAFADRCPRAQPRCRREHPGLTAAPAEPAHSAACHFPLD